MNNLKVLIIISKMKILTELMVIQLLYINFLIKITKR